MNPTLLFPFILVIISLLFQASNTFYQSGNKINDLLSYTNAGLLNNEATSWSFSELACPTCTTKIVTLRAPCYSSAPTSILGGPNILGPAEQSTEGEYLEGTFPLGTNTWTSFGLEFDLWIFSTDPISSPNVNSMVDFSLNGVDFDLPTGDITASYGVCLVNYTMNNGIDVANTSLYRFSIETIVPFDSSGTANFRLISKQLVPSNTTSFGIRRFYMYLLNTTNIGTENFPCATNYYWDSNLNCSLCHQYCSKCDGPTNNECSACTAGNYYYQNGTCLDYCDTSGPLMATTSYYCSYKCTNYQYPQYSAFQRYYWAYNDTCSTCSFPLKRTNGLNSVTYCSSPCPTQYFYPNGSCETQCAGFWEPIVEEVNIVQYCKNPCGTFEFMYPDGTCENSCPSPLLDRIEPDMTFCYTPCAPGDYLYPNSSCYSTCDPILFLPQTDNRNINYCTNPCSSGMYLYPDGSCNSTCAFPLVNKTEPGFLYCVTPCLGGQYLYPNGSCYNTCNEPLVPMEELAKSFKFCTNPCDPLGTTKYLYPNSTCSDICLSPLLSRTEPDALYCYTPCASNEYLYLNGTCSEDCLSPLVWVKEGDFLFCRNPCGTTSLFLYPNGTCLNDCPLPLLSREEGGVVKYCYTPCSGTLYLYPNGTCAGCDTPWLKISEPSNFEFCRNPCDPLGTMKYLYPNSTCSDTCPSPLSQRTEPDAKYCYTPCPENQYLYPNETCAGCDTPWLKISEPSHFEFCRNPCDPNGVLKYLYPNTTCSSDCPSPLVSRDEPDAKYCYTPCPENQYLYPNGTCAGCDTPWLKISEPSHFEFCRNPCGVSMFLYSDSSCNITCPSPLFNRTEPDVKYCYNPCASNKTFLSEIQVCQKACHAPSTIINGMYAKYCYFPCRIYDDYYNMIEEKCEETCDYPYTAMESSLPKLCISSLTDEERKQVEEMMSATDAAGTASSTATLIWSLVSSGDSTVAMMGPLAKMLQYIKFMDIAFPEKVQLMLLEQTKRANKKGWVQKMLGSALDKFPNHEMNENFRFYSIKSSFFVNFWPSLFNISAIVAVTLLVVLATAHTKGKPKIHGILKSASEALKWNVFLITFCGVIGDIVLFTSLELETMQFENAESVISLITCLGINILTVFVVIKMLDVNSAIRRAKKSNPDEQEMKRIEQEWSSYKALFECYKDYSFYQQIFLFVFTMRLVLFNASVGYLYKYPLFQATVSLVMNIVMLGYLIVRRPMRKMVSLIQQIVLEFLLLPFNACVLALAVMDDKGLVEVDRRKAIGNVIFYINVIIPILSVVLIAAKFIAMAVDLYKTWKLSKKPKGLAIDKQERWRSQPMSLENSTMKSLTSENNNSTIQTLDTTDHHEMNMIGSTSQFESPVQPRIRGIRRPQMKNYYHNFLTPENPNRMRNLTMPSDYQNMMGNSSMTPYYQDSLNQQQFEVPGIQEEFMVQQEINRTQSNFELHNNENNVNNDRKKTELNV